MLGSEWVTAAVTALLVAHLVAAAYAYRKRSEPPAAGRTVGAGEADSDEGVCTCPDCGAENESGYRFCKRCVAELPGGSVPLDRPGGREQPY